MTINYVLCCWSGNRRVQDLRYKADPTFYLRKHLRSLHKFSHRLSRITIAVPDNPSEPPSYTKLLKELPAKIHSAEVVLLRRPNVGLSYGSFSDAYGSSRGIFDHYFMVEDDVAFMQHHFDDLHLEVMREDAKCGYVCAYAAHNGHPLHAAISTGMMRCEALEKIWHTVRCIPHCLGADYGAAERYGQVGVSQAMQHFGYTLRDWRGKYKVGFRLPDMGVAWDHHDCPAAGLKPISGPL